MSQKEEDRVIFEMRCDEGRKGQDKEIRLQYIDLLKEFCNKGNLVFTEDLSPHDIAAIQFSIAMRDTVLPILLLTIPANKFNQVILVKENGDQVELA